MLRLIRNCSHNNEVSTFYLEDGTGNWIVKSSSSVGGVEQIKQEVMGWEWYSSKVCLNGGSSPCQVVEDRKNYIRIRVRYIEGHKVKYSRGILRNSAVVTSAIKHYFKVWGQGNPESFPLHGDLSIDNVISSKEGVRIIDWEHFCAKGAPLGLDVYNLLFEQLWFSMKGRERPNKSELCILSDNIRLIRELSGPNVFFQRPLFNLQEFIRNNKVLWMGQILRLPVLLFNNNRVKIIDEVIDHSLKD